MTDEKPKLPTGTSLTSSGVGLFNSHRFELKDWQTSLLGDTNVAAVTRGRADLVEETKFALAQVNRVAERYGDAGKAGWSPLPDVLLFNQRKLGLNSEDLNVLLNMLAHYYLPGAMPFVRANVIAKRMGVSTRSVQRSIARMRKKNLIAKRQGPKRQVVHDLTPLLSKLQPLAKERLSDRANRQAALAQERGLLGIDSQQLITG